MDMTPSNDPEDALAFVEKLRKDVCVITWMSAINLFLTFLLLAVL